MNYDPVHGVCDSTAAGLFAQVEELASELAKYKRAVEAVHAVVEAAIAEYEHRNDSDSYWLDELHDAVRAYKEGQQ